ncbi:pentapeptide repeat-containing protein [Saccharothrix sp. NRRL B-16348]|uniref:pentapeptide repeat-containing protein n=1 Tax=Saccharothrix sp. NRRL B-16348 TaxID=1415542 RepID=UPI0006ADD994|nr:pentapeptide repeat-containing protein [Saccharothrix sp. NRRL B-16348]
MATRSEPRQPAGRPPAAGGARALLGRGAVVAGALVALWTTQPLWEPVWSWLVRWWPLPVAALLIAAGLLLTGQRDSSDADALEVRPLSARAIVLGALALTGISAAAAALLLDAFGGGAPAERLEALRTAGTIVIGSGGGAALLLNARRQRATELALAHQQLVATAAEHDATERRTTELFTRAVEHLGSDKVPVRYGGLYALERLAQDNPQYRQTTVNVLCAYLRVPYAPRPALGGLRGIGVRARPAPTCRAAASVNRADEHRRQEHEVRVAAERILADHLRPHAPPGAYWADIDLDLAGATLLALDLTDCRLRSARFRGAVFTGDTSFIRAEIAADACFERARFAGQARFSAATFAGKVDFSDAVFAEGAWFSLATCTGRASFARAAFTGDSWFTDALFAAAADFPEAVFGGSASFKRVTFAGTAAFDRATFTGPAWFDGATFGERDGGGDGHAVLCPDFADTVFAAGVPDAVARFVPAGDRADR